MPAENQNMKYRRLFISLSFGLLGLLVVAGSADALAVRNGAVGYYVDLPVGWQVVDAEDPEIISFSDPSSNAYFQIFAFPGDRFASAREVHRFFEQQLRAGGDSEGFEHAGRQAMFADLQFPVGGRPVRGYSVFVDSESAEEWDYGLVTFAFEEHYETFHDFLLSALDSFAIDEGARLFPGPVSEYFYPFPGPEEAPVAIALGSGETRTDALLPVDPGAVDANQVMIEREARILSVYQPNTGADWQGAWRRFYRMVYRDTYRRLSPLVPAVHRHTRRHGIPREEVPVMLLDWLQEMEYARITTLSDLESPVQSVVNGAGDCDSLGLAYVILLHQLGYDAIMMVSPIHAHAMAAVDLEGAGARFPFEGRQWLVAELTADVAIGMIAQDMADPADWIGIRLRTEVLQ